MRRFHLVLLVFFILGLVSRSFSQTGWTANITIDINHPNYGIETLSGATVSYSGFTQSAGPSSGPFAEFSFSGSGTPGGALSITATGIATGPYYGEPEPVSLYVTYTGNFASVDCNTYLFYANVMNSELYGRITLFPRQVITTSAYADCTNTISISTGSCTGVYNYTWELGPDSSGPWTIIPGQSGSTMVISKDQVHNIIGAYGKVYFRVTGAPGTTSQPWPLDVYAPGPSASFNKTDQTCFDVADGSLKISIGSAHPSITSFVANLYNDVPPAGWIKNEPFSGTYFEFTNLAEGTYYVRLENNFNVSTWGSCFNFFGPFQVGKPVPVTIPSFTTSNYNGYTISCKGGNNGTLTAHPSGGSGVFTEYSWTPNVSSGQTAGGLSEQSYTVRVKDSKGCWSAGTTKFMNAPPPVSLNVSSIGGLGGYDVSCWNKADGALAATATGGVAGYSYSWSTGGLTGSISSLPTGTYTAFVTDGNGCSTSNARSLTAPPPIDFSIQQVAGLTCAGDNTAVLQAQSVVNTIGGILYSWSSGETVAGISNKGAGTYYLTISDGQGCNTQKSITLADPPLFSASVSPVSNYNGSRISCYGEDDGKLIAILKDAGNNVVSGQHYAWYKNGIPLAQGPSLSSLDFVSEATYKAVVTYNLLCKAEATYFIDDPDPVVPDISSNTNYNGSVISCFGQSDASLKVITTGGTSSYSYAWSTGATTSIVNNLPAGSYSVIVTDANGCTNSDSETITGPAPVSATIESTSNFNGQPISCYNASDAILSATGAGGTGAFTYLWSTGATGKILNNLGAGVYSVAIRDANNCQATKDFTLVNPTHVIAWISQQSNYNGYGVKCAGDSNGFFQAAGSGGTGSYTFSWLNSSNTSALHSNLVAGSYSVKVRDLNGCENTATAIISEPGVLGLSVINTEHVKCFNGSSGSVTLQSSGGAGLNEYTYDGNLTWQALPVFSGLTAKIFTFTVRDANGCQKSISQTLQQPPPLNISFTDVTPAFCASPVGAATGHVSGGTGAYLFDWRDSQNNAVGLGSTISNQKAGIYTLNVRDANDCRSMNSVGITSADGAKLEIVEVTPITCSYTSDGTALLEIVSGQDPFKIVWPDGQSSLQVTGLTGGIHLVSVTDGNDCEVIKEVSVASPELLELALVSSTSPLCHGDCGGRIKVAAHGGTGLYTYSWQNSEGDELINACKGEYSVTVIDENGCNSTQVFSLEEPEMLKVNLKSYQIPQCLDDCNGRLTVEGVGGVSPYQYTWSNTEKSAAIENICPAVYAVRITDANGCMTEDSFELANPAVSALDLGTEITLCAGQTHHLDAGPQWLEYRWGSSTGFSSSLRNVTISEAGQYWLDVVNELGCTARDTFLLKTSSDLLRAELLMASEAETGDTVVFIDVSWPLPESIEWVYPPAMRKILDLGDVVFGQFDTPGDYEVRLTAHLGECRDDMTKTISILKSRSEDHDGRLGYKKFVQHLELYPNPNDGSFYASVLFTEESPLSITIFSNLTSYRITEYSGAGKSEYQFHVDIRPLPPGVYVLMLEHKMGRELIRFIVK